ncbi:hypothetical protein EP7_005051 [Isosphaeraceae bacterium EP7]
MNLSLLNLWNQHDESIARKYRADFGLKGWLLSWQLTEDGFWQATISTRELPYSISRTGRSRFQAIDRAYRAMGAMLALRGDRSFFTNRITPEPESTPES